MSEEYGFRNKHELQAENAALKAENEELKREFKQAIDIELAKIEQAAMAAIEPLKAELKAISVALDDPSTDLTMTTVEVITALKAELASVRHELESEMDRYDALKSQEHVAVVAPDFGNQGFAILNTKLPAGTKLFTAPQPAAVPAKTCICGVPQSLGIVHSADTPCYYAAPEAPQAQDKDGERYRWLRDNNACVLECVVEKRGFRSTMPNAQREAWTEREGWTVSTLPMSAGPYPTMDAAIDQAIKESK